MGNNILYYECFHGTTIPFDNFVSDAVIGAYKEGWICLPFDDIESLPYSEKNMLVASVDTTQRYLKKYLGFELSPINYHEVMSDFLYRKTEIVDIKNIKPPCFIKPNKIKAFTGFVVTGNKLLDVGFDNLTNNYQGDVYMEDVLDIVSEYRAYIKRGMLIGLKHYSGNVFFTLKDSTVLHAVHQSRNFNNLSLTLDFGVLRNGDTILIEANDGWSIGNYGLDPIKFFHFIKERWFQIIREKK